MLKNKKKVKIVTLSILFCAVVFLLGLCIGAKYFGVQHKKIKFEAKTIRFYTIKKMLGKTINNDEKVVVKKFQENTENCIKNFSTEEQKKVDVLKDEVLSLAKGNDKIAFRLKDLRSIKRKELVSLAKKIKEIIDTTSSFADWLNNPNVRNRLKFDIKVCLIKNGYPPQYSPEVFRKVMEQVENFSENN